LPLCNIFVSDGTIIEDVSVDIGLIRFRLFFDERGLSHSLLCWCMMLKFCWSCICHDYVYKCYSYRWIRWVTTYQVIPLCLYYIPLAVILQLSSSMYVIGCQLIVDIVRYLCLLLASRKKIMYFINLNFC